MRPKICIGMFVYNEEKHLSEALNSLIQQTYRDFRLIILDDYSTDKTESIVRRYAKRDNRISFYRNRQRMGYIYNYRKTFELAGNEVDYFAWAAGHDVYHSRWLKTMVKVLEDNPNSIMAYSLTMRVSDEGKILQVPPTIFETQGMDTRKRIYNVCFKGEGFGNMIYGLFRAWVIRKVGMFPPVLLPDVVLLTQLSLYGDFVLVKEKLWFRRYVGLFSIDRQKKISFSRIPWYAQIPWPITNSIFLFFKTFLGINAGDLKQRIYGLQLSMLFFIAHYYSILKHYPTQSKYYMVPYYLFIFIKKQWGGTYNFLRKIL